MNAATNPMLERHAPLWQRLRAWLKEALYQHQHKLEYLSRAQLQPFRGALTLLEHVLRRLVILAASTQPVDRPAQWAPAPKPSEVELLPEAETEPEPQPVPSAPAKPNKPKVRFRIYGVYWPRDAAATPTTQPTATAMAAALDPEAAGRIITIRINLGGDALLSAGDGPKRTRGKPGRRTTSRRPRRSCTPPDLTIEQFDAWLAAQPPIDWNEVHADRLREMNEAGGVERPGKAAQHGHHRCSAETAGQAPGGSGDHDLISTQPLLDRLALLQQYIENPEALIRRVARAFARRRELALKLAKARAPKATALLAQLPDFYGTLIPLHAELTLAMEYFAASYVECDTS